ncbi:MAG TPA: hypothetical protein PK323_07510 [Bacteroidia bacterium]|nr:hypothetical protein [Bacteroidia bacterium]
MKETFKPWHLFLLPILLFTFAIGKAQNITNSIYSRYAYGTETFKGFATNIALGGTGVAQKGPWQLNYFNPASNAAIKLTSFNAGISGNYMQQSNKTDTIINKSGSFGYLAIGFPLTKWWGLSFGLLPYSGVGYKVADTIAFNKRNIANTYKGSGGLNKLYFANGFNPFKIFSDSLMQGFAIGVSSEFNFGSITNEESNSFVGADTSYHLLILNNRYSSYNGFSFNFGLQHTINIKDESKLTLGFTYGLKGTLNKNTNISTERYINTLLASTLVDTAYYNENPKETAFLPSSYAFGFNLQMGPKMSYSMEYKVVKWGSDSISGKLNNLKDSRIISAGFQYYPNSQSPDGLFGHTYYRFGIKNTVLPFYLNNTQLLENAITMGFGFPLRKAVSTVNIGMELGRRGTTLYNLVKENYFMVNVGFTINDKWFMKSKFD